MNAFDNIMNFGKLILQQHTVLIPLIVSRWSLLQLKYNVVCKSFDGMIANVRLLSFNAVYGTHFNHNKDSIAYVYINYSTRQI